MAAEDGRRSGRPQAVRRRSRRLEACYLTDDDLRTLAARAEALRGIGPGDVTEPLATAGESSWPYAVSPLRPGVGPVQAITADPFDLRGEAS